MSRAATLGVAEQKIDHVRQDLDLIARCLQVVSLTAAAGEVAGMRSRLAVLRGDVSAELWAADRAEHPDYYDEHGNRIGPRGRHNRNTGHDNNDDGGEGQG